mgnify:CR=1 FL=1|tara:strand:+ start:1703 stop:1888 length:186 start_codon:yes stop_codon:yes gene_type:complete
MKTLKTITTINKLNLLLAYTFVIMLLFALGLPSAACFALVGPLVVLAVGSALNYAYLVVKS